MAQMDLDAAGSYHQNPGLGQPLPGDNKFRELRNDVNQLADVMKSNINKVLERGDHMDALNERSELLSSRANEFRINSLNVRRKFWWQNLGIQLVCGFVCLTIIVIIAYSIIK